MIRRLLELLSCTAIGGSVALAVGAEPVQVIGGAGAGALLWMVFDHQRLQRLLDWLRQGQGSHPPDVPDDWAELVERSQKGYKWLEREVAKAEERQQQLVAAFQASPNGVLVLDSSERIALCNQAAADHLGFDAQRDLGQYLVNMVRDPVFVAYLRSENYAQPIEMLNRSAGGNQPRRISLQFHPYGPGNRLLLTRDVTGLEIMEAMRRDFVANVSHEIRTPLTVLHGFVETMLSYDLEATERERYLLLMHQQSQRMMGLVNDLLLLSRLEGTPVPGRSDWFSAADLLAQVVRDAQVLSDAIADGGHDIHAEPCPHTLQIAGAKTELLSAMSNLIGNAVRYTPSGGHIRAGWRTLPQGEVEYWVADTGPGIAAEHIPRLTERFYRVDRSRSRETGGTGLGLAIVKHVIQRHGGQLHIDSTVGVGSTFRLLLPTSRVRWLEENAE